MSGGEDWLALAATPPRGWNSWNQVHENVDEKTVRDAADAMVRRGLASAGYKYVVVDDCWQAPERDAQGRLQADPERFPSGMRALADHVHSMGLKFGIYSAPGERTCAGRLGSLGHERLDADLFASWGVDFLKYDWCNAGHATAENELAAFTVMRDALIGTGRDIVYSISEYGIARPWDWGKGVAHLWRTTFDIWPHWGSVYGILNQHLPVLRHSGPGGWCDPDMLQVGNGSLTPAENRSHMALWALLPAPLFAGNNLRDASDEVIALLTHPGLLELNGDPLGRPARLVAAHPEFLVFVRELSGGGWAVALLNHGEARSRAWADLPAYGLVGRYRGVELLTGNPIGETSRVEATLDAHETALFRLVPIR